jgi:hypothetical protein
MMGIVLAVGRDAMVDIDLTKVESMKSFEGVRLSATGVRLAPEPGEWTEIFRGKAEFGFITGLFPYKNKVLVLDSPLPAGADGGTIHQLDLDKGQSRKVLDVQEQGLIYIREQAGKLYAPGPDGIEDWKFGNIYRSSDGEKWTKLRSVPNAVHIWDMCSWKGKLYVSTGSVKNNEGYAAVLQSSDEGKTWREVMTAYPPDRKKQFARAYALIPLPDGLYASFAAVDNKPAEPGPKPSVDFYRYDGRRWTPLKLFENPARSPYFGLRHREFGAISLVGFRGGAALLSAGKLTPIPELEGLTVMDFERVGEENVYALANESGRSALIYGASFASLNAGTVNFQKVGSLPLGTEGLSLTSLDARLLVGTKATGGGQVYAEANHQMGTVVTKAVQLTNQGRVKLSWTGEQPEGCSLQFQVHAGRSERDLDRSSSWSTTRDVKSPSEIELRGLPRGEIWIQVRIVMRTEDDLTGPVVKGLKLRSER